MPFFLNDAGALAQSVPIIDVHVHLGESDTGAITYPTLHGDEYLGIMDAVGIDGACTFPPLRTDGYRTANHALAEWAGSVKARVLPFARLGGRRVPVKEPHAWLIRHAMRRYVSGAKPDLDTLESLAHFAGVKLLPVMDGVPSDDLFARMRELRLPVLVHGGQYVPPRWIERTMLPRTKGPVIIAHLGAYPNHESLLRDAVDLARREERVYLDTSGVWPAAFLHYAVARVPEKLLFGSDAPLVHPLAAWQHLASVVPDDPTLERISHGTARALLNL